MSNTADQPLHGVRIIDFSSLVPGPLSTLILMEAGAEVIRVTRPEGDPMAALPPHVDGMNAEHCLLVAGKKAVTADLRTPADLARVRELIRDADVLVDGFRPGVMERLGLGYQALQAVNPRLIYCSITGYGQTGPWRDRAGHDLNYQAESGLLALSPGTAETPSVPPALVADIAGGSYPAVINILLALIRRDRTGVGCHIDVAMADGAATFLLQAQARREATGKDPKPRGGMLTGGTPRYALYATRDAQLLAVGAIEDKFWRAACAVFGVSTDATQDDLRTTIGGQDAAYWQAAFRDVDACVSLVLPLSEALESPQAVARGLYARKVEAPGGSLLTALPVPIADTFRSKAKVRSMAQ